MEAGGGNRVGTWQGGDGELTHWVAGWTGGGLTHWERHAEGTGSGRGRGRAGGQGRVGARPGRAAHGGDGAGAGGYGVGPAGGGAGARPGGVAHGGDRVEPISERSLAPESCGASSLQHREPLFQIHTSESSLCFRGGPDNFTLDLHNYFSLCHWVINPLNSKQFSSPSFLPLYSTFAFIQILSLSKVE